MEKEEMKQRWEEYYAIMANSGNPKYMMLFGEVMKEMMEHLIAIEPNYAEKMLEKLCAVKWRNYLTLAEAEAVVSKMDPQPTMTRDMWARQIERMGMPMYEEPYYNRWALYATMMMKNSDDRTAIAQLMGKTLDDVTMDEMTVATHLLAMSVLKDKDFGFDIRHYYNL